MGSWDDDLVDEVLRADDGCILGNCQSGYAYTDRARVERQKVCLSPWPSSRHRLIHNLVTETRSVRGSSTPSSEA